MAVRQEKAEKTYYFIFSPFEPYFNHSLTYDKAAIGDGYASLTSGGADEEFCIYNFWCTGRVYYQTPGRPEAGKGVSFSTKFVFAMFPMINTSRNANGDGIVFFLGQNATWDQGQPDGRFGLFSNDKNFTDSNPFFAVEFDTMINAEFGDQDDNHVGVDNNSPVSLFSAPAMDINIDLNDGKRIAAWIDYDNLLKKLEVRMSYDRPSILKPSIPLLSCTYDLDQINLTHFYPGFSSSSAHGSEQRHIIYTWEFDAQFVWVRDPEVVATTSATTVVGGIVVVGLLWFCCVRYTNFGKRQHARCMNLFGSVRSKVVEHVGKNKVNPKKEEATIQKKEKPGASDDDAEKLNSGFSKFEALSRTHPMLVSSFEDSDEDYAEEDPDEEYDDEKDEDEEYDDEKDEDEDEEEEEEEETEDDETSPHFPLSYSRGLSA
ncbi:hypothetical protein R1flu_003411 [Riccia fluitans]|uniref:Legume lectin domain-containing protein n=1 Tax=Riccia fluitans TaxID=41844 RepID=A0ABD1Y9B1_9MARC